MLITNKSLSVKRVIIKWKVSKESKKVNKVVLLCGQTFCPPQGSIIINEGEFKKFCSIHIPIDRSVPIKRYAQYETEYWRHV